LDGDSLEGSFDAGRILRENARMAMLGASKFGLKAGDAVV
jgi:hypothetical protein